MLSSSHRFLSHPNGSNDDNTYRGKLHFVGCKGRAVHWLCVVKIITAITTQTECGDAQWARERTKLYWPPAYLFGHQHFSGLDRPFIKRHSTGAFMLLLLGKAKALSTIYIYAITKLLSSFLLSLCCWCCCREDNLRELHVAFDNSWATMLFCERICDTFYLL